jgi:hypothetical protein
MSSRGVYNVLPPFRDFLNTIQIEPCSNSEESTEDCKLAPLRFSDDMKRRHLNWRCKKNRARKMFLRPTDQLSEVLNIRVEEYAWLYVRTHLVLPYCELNLLQKRTLDQHLNGISKVLFFSRYTLAELKFCVQKVQNKERAGQSLSPTEKIALRIFDNPVELNNFEKSFEDLQNLLCRI